MAQERIERLPSYVDYPEQFQPEIAFKEECKVKSYRIESEVKDLQKRIEMLGAQLERIEQSKAALKDAKEVFAWDIAFVEFFECDEQGFDIVIGNPPYVRQENISDPLLPRDKVTAEKKREYKDKLARSIY